MRLKMPKSEMEMVNIYIKNKNLYKKITPINEHYVDKLYSPTKEDIQIHFISGTRIFHSSGLSHSIYLQIQSGPPLREC